MPRQEDRETPRQRRLAEREQRSRIKATETATRGASTNNMLQQLSTLYGIGSQSDMDAQKLQKGQMELDLMPQQAEAALTESRARVRENEAQADYYKLRGEQDQMADPRILQFIQDPNNIPDWMIPFMPKESQQALREGAERKRIAKQNALDEEARRTGAPPPPSSGTALPPGITPSPGANIGNLLRQVPDRIQRGGSDLPNVVGGFGTDLLQGVTGTSDETIRNINDILRALFTSPGEGLQYWQQQFTR